jgi:transposase
MVQEGQVRKKYPSDLTDEQWAIVEPLIPPAKQSPRGGRPRKVNMREVLNTLLYLNRSGCQWDMLPHDLPPKSTVYDYFVQWRDDGTWAKLSARTKIFLYVKILSTFADSPPSLFTTLINKKDMLTDAIYSKFKPRNSQLTP